MSEKPDEKEELSSEKQFYKIVKDFVRDILITFPEYKDKLVITDFKIWIKFATKEINITLDKEDEQTKSVYKYCQKYYPDKFFDILYEKEEIITGDDSFFLPAIRFSEIWKENITDSTKQTIWKYLQLILFSVVQNSQENFFGENTSKLFEAINQEEFKDKLEETIGEMQNIFDFSNIDLGDLPDGQAFPDLSGIDQDALPNVEKLHENINSMLDGKIGRLAKEIAEETTQDLNIDMDDATSMNDVFEKLFKNPTKLMGLVKNVGTKLDNKIKSGEIKESELIEEAQGMVENMQNIPGMGSMQDLFTKMGMGGMGGMGGGKMNMNAMKSQMNQNLRQAKMKERMQKKLAEKNKQQESMSNMQDTQEPIVFSTGEKVEKTARKNNKKKTNRKKKNKQKK